MWHKASSSNKPKFEIFLSHAAEDKETIARPLYERLSRHGLSVFLDNESFRLGDDCPQVMKDAMKTAPIGIFIMSPEFVAKEWPMRELMVFVRRFDDAVARNKTRPLLIPIFYRFSTDQCRDPNIFDTYSSLFLKWGLFRRASNGDVELKDVNHALDTAAKVWSIENNCGASNSNSPEMRPTRKYFLEYIEKEILKLLGMDTSEMLTRGNAVLGDQSPQRDTYSSCTMVLPNPPRLTLDYGSPNTCEGRLKAEILKASERRIDAVVASGRGGVGKTCALRGLAEDEDIKRVFRGGILYIQLGNDAAESTVIEEIARTVDCTGGSKLSSEITACKSVREASQKASQWFRSESCLFLIDDIWELNGIDCDVLSDLGLIVNEKSRMVYTTRDKHFLKRANTVIEFKEKEAYGKLSQRMLMKHAGFDETTVLNHKNKEAFKYFLTLCQGLPLGFGIVGSSVGEYARDCLPREDAWSEFYHDVVSQQKDIMQETSDSYGILLKIVDLSLQVLGERHGHGKFEYWFRSLCVLKRQQTVPVEMLQKLWNFESLRETRRVVQSFVDVSVVQQSIINGSVFVKLHDLILDIATRKAGGMSERRAFFQTLLGNYLPRNRMNGRDTGILSELSDGMDTVFVAHALRGLWNGIMSANKNESMRQEYCHGWWNEKDDGYIHNNLCRLLRNAGYGDELLWLLSQPQWIVQRLVESGIFGVEEDLGHGKGVCSDDSRQSSLRKEHLEMIGRATRLGALFVNKNRRVEEGWFQVHGRLLWHARQNELTKEFVERMERSAPKPWLKAGEGLLEQAGCGAVRVINVEDEGLCIRIEPEAIWVLFSYPWGDKVHVGRYETSSEDYKEKRLEKPAQELGRMQCASFLLDGRRVVTAHYGGKFCVWNRQTGALEKVVAHECEKHRSFIDFCADGALLACELEDHIIRLWETLSGKAVGQPLEGHIFQVTRVAANADGSRILSGSMDKTLRMWDVESGNAVGQLLEGHRDAVRCVALNADGTCVVSGLSDGTVRVWDAEGGKVVGKRLQVHTEDVRCVAVNADGTRIVSGSSDGTVRVWDAENGNAVGKPLEGHTEEVICVAVNADCTRIVSFSRYGTVRVWDAESINAVGKPLEGHTHSVRCVAVSADGTRIVSGSTDGTLRMWDAESGNAVGQPLEGHTGEVSCVAVNADGTRIVSVSQDRMVCDTVVRVWDAESGNAVGQPLEGHSDWVECVAVSADGTRIVFGSTDGTVRVWDAGSGNAVGKPLEVHAHWVKCVAVNADGSRVVSDDGEMKLLWALNGDGVKCVLTSRDAEWQRAIDALELTWSRGKQWEEPWEREVRAVVENGSEIVLGTSERGIRNIRGGDVYFTEYFRSCRIVR